VNAEAARVAEAVLYEGYLLWPYHRSATKNQQRWTFGGVFPPGWSAEHPDDAETMVTQVLVTGGDAAVLDVRVRFLQVVDRQVCRRDADGALEPVDALVVDGERHVSWEEAVERDVVLGAHRLAALDGAEIVAALDVGAGEAVEPLDEHGAIARRWHGLRGTVTLGAERLDERLRRITVTIANRTPWAGGTRPDALRRATISTHTMLEVAGGELVSLTDPPARLREQAAGCANVGCWPVLVGAPGAADAMLSSPIILEDHPRIAPESPGDLFDGVEIDELLILNVLHLSDAEREEMRASDPRARAILERCERLGGDELLNLHGRLSDLRPARELR
jgi:hydrogenase maturation protease